MPKTEYERETLQTFQGVLLDYLTETTGTLCLVLDETLKVTFWNAVLKYSLGYDTLPGDGMITDFLLDHMESLPVVSSEMPQVSCELTFRHVAGGTVSFRCLITKQANSYLILGEPLENGHERVLRQMTLLSNEVANMNRELSQKNAKLEAAQEKIRALSGIVPICAHCRKIRDDDGYWNQLEEVLAKYADTLFSHGICPECLQEHYPEEFEAMSRKRE